jgi:hypothetical protein
MGLAVSESENIDNATVEAGLKAATVTTMTTAA